MNKHEIKDKTKATSMVGPKDQPLNTMEVDGSIVAPGSVNVAKEQALAMQEAAPVTPDTIKKPPDVES